MKKILLVIVVFVICAAGLLMFSKQVAPGDKEAETGIKFSVNVPQPAAALALQPGESAEIEVTSELREYYFGLARTQAWFYLPEFTEGEPPTEPLDYWFMLLLEGVTGWDEYGYYQLQRPWREVDENTPEGYGSYGMPVISQAEMDEWVAAHFGEVELAHKVERGKYCDFDGENYYGWAGGGFPVMYYGLEKLQAENVDNRLIYTALLNDYQFNEYNYFYPDSEMSPEENRAALAECAASAEYGEPAVYAAYGEQLINGELKMDEAIRQMIINGQTTDFVCVKQLEVKYYLDETTGEPVYLQVHWQETAA